MARTATSSGVDAERIRPAAAHLLAVRREARLLADQDDVGVRELPAARADLLPRLREQLE